MSSEEKDSLSITVERLAKRVDILERRWTALSRAPAGRPAQYRARRVSYDTDTDCGPSVYNHKVDDELRKLFELIDQERFDEARAAIAALEPKLGDGEPELTRASSLIRFLEEPV